MSVVVGGSVDRGVGRIPENGRREVATVKPLRQ